MACCDEIVSEHPSQSFDLKDLPDTTFCCMGRVAYMLCANAYKFLRNIDSQPWSDMTEAEKLALGSKAKAIVCGLFVPQTEFDRLMEATLKTMATAA